MKLGVALPLAGDRATPGNQILVPNAPRRSAAAPHLDKVLDVMEQLAPLRSPRAEPI